MDQVLWLLIPLSVALVSTLFAVNTTDAFPVIKNPWWNGFVWGVGASSLTALGFFVFGQSHL